MIEFLLDGIYGAVIGTFIGIGLEKWYRFWKIKQEYSLLQTVFPVTTNDHDIEVKCSIKQMVDGQNPPSLRAYVHSAETLALQKIAKYLDDVQVKLKFSSFYGIPQEGRNLLLIGAGAYNELSKSIMEDMGGLSYQNRMNEHGCFIYKRKKYKCIHDNNSDHKVLEDYGIILRKPVWENNIVLLFGGIHMHGTLAAAEIAMSTAFQKRIKELGCKYYVQLVKVRVASDGLSIAPEIAWETLPFIELSK